MHNGLFLVIEGADGSGKGTQFRLLKDRLEKEGYDVAAFDFPQYDQSSSYFVKQYLNGKYGTAQDVGPYTSSLFYALDRYQAAPQIRQALAAGKVVLANRYTGSSMAHQGTSFNNAEERRGYFIWLDNLEFQMLNIPRPSANLVLRVPAETAQQLIDNKTPRSYTDKKRDILEDDLGHLQKAVQVYDDLCQLFPRDFVSLNCIQNGTLQPIEIIQEQIWQSIQALLPPKPQTSSVATTHTDDAQVTLLDEFAQAAGRHIVIENASNILAKKLESGRLATYLEQPAIYSNFDKKDVDGNYRYHTPGHFSPAVKQHYNAVMDQIFDIYAGMVNDLTAHIQANSKTPSQERSAAWQNATRTQAYDLVRPTLPVAAKSTVDIHASGQALDSLITRLLGDDLPEAQAVGRQILEKAHKLTPTLLEGVDQPDGGGSTIAYRANTYKAVKELAEAYLPIAYANQAEPIQLTSLWPRNELDLLPDMLYEHSSLSLKEISKEVDGWSYDRKVEVFTAFIGERLNRRHKPGRALEKAHYSWDIVCDYDIFRDMQRHRQVDDLEWQFLTPRYGYEMPDLIDEAGLSDNFEKCFDLSLELYSFLQENDSALEAQYATLLGHRMRWKVTYNAREAFHLHELQTTPQGQPGYRKFVQQMHQKVAEVHPMLAEAMVFVNKD
ncbi:MAG: FAD-dependent thymidylate synthase [Candidatus Saccharimonadales bacterium]